jgi:hypothetical protein
LRPDVEKTVHKLATKKLADRYIGRRGEPPSLSSQRLAATQQDLNDDDRKHLRWCLETLRIVAWGKEVEAAFEFIEALLVRDYALDRGKELELEKNQIVNRLKDPDLYRHLSEKSRKR